MSKQFRDVTGGEQMMASIIPGYGLINYILGWFTVPIEVFLRRNFGERYFTRANFLAGLFLLLIFQFSADIIAFVAGPMSFIFGHSGTSDSSPVMWFIIKLYLFVGILHFLRMWWNDIMGHPVHSFSAGSSWLRPVGRGIMTFFNVFLNRIVEFAVRNLPAYRNEMHRLESALPVLRDVDTFTERYVEPVVVFIVALFFSADGDTRVFFWLLFSIAALNFYTGIRHQGERGQVLDVLDSIIVNDQLSSITSGGPLNASTRSSQLERIVIATAVEADRKPEVMTILRQEQPSLADAVAAYNARRKKTDSVNRDA